MTIDRAAQIMLAHGVSLKRNVWVSKHGIVCCAGGLYLVEKYGEWAYAHLKKKVFPIVDPLREVVGDEIAFITACDLVAGSVGVTPPYMRGLSTGFEGHRPIYLGLLGKDYDEGYEDGRAISRRRKWNRSRG